MTSIRFTDVQARPSEFLDLTSLTLDEFQQLVLPLNLERVAYQCMGSCQSASVVSKR
jgi:hypothetical protein